MIEISPVKPRVIAHIPSMSEGQASLQGSPNRRRNFNNDQEVHIDAHAPLFLLNDVSTHHLIPKYTGRPIAPLRINTEALDHDKKNRDDDEKRHEIDDDHHDSESNSQSGSGSTKLREAKEVDVFGENENKNEKKNRKRFRLIAKILESVIFQVLINSLTVYALFADDFRSILAPPSADVGFSIVAIVIMAIFTLEIVANCLVQKDYLFSFTFFLDIVGTVSMIFDITWFEAIINGNSTSLAKTAQGARVGGRAGRIVRVVRLVRLLKLVKATEKKRNSQNDLGKILPMQDSQTNIKGSLASVDREGNLLSPTKASSASDHHLSAHSIFFHEDEMMLKESRVGKQLSNLTIKRVVTIVLLLMFIIPLFSTDFWFDPDREYTYMADDLKAQIVSGLNGTDVETYVNLAVRLCSTQFEPVIQFVTPNYTYQSIDPSTLRDSDQLVYYSFFDGTIYAGIYNPIIVILDQRPSNRMDAELGIGTTLFISIVFVLASIYFNQDVRILAIDPIERMIKKVNRIASNPLLAREEEMILDTNPDVAQNEAVQIENAIIKIGTLLALGFGDAGADIIAQNMAAGGDVNPMIRGQKKMAIFGFCDIRNFTDATEVLQEEVMVFVNTIGEIVHRIVDKYTGSANKNIGDAFLLAWKFPDEEICHPTIEEIDVRGTRLVQNISDLAVISFLKIYARINKDPKLLSYRTNQKLNARIPNYKVKMGFGLHIGWAIEGAIGSEFKIDASYLSPNVNMASRLEAATKQYGVPLLISGALHDKCSKNLRDIMRHIDRVTVKGSKQPVDFYTIDCNLEDLPACTPKTLTKMEIRQKRRQSKMQIYQEIIENEAHASDLLVTDKDLKVMTKDNGVGPFYGTFKAGFKAYLKGDWSTSKRKFEECLTLNPSDGPTNTLYEFLKENDFIAPDEWKGYRVLTDK